jgi:hypothetical protein
LQIERITQDLPAPGGALTIVSGACSAEVTAVDWESDVFICH